MKKVEVHIEPILSKGLVVGNKIFRSPCDYQLTEKDLEKARKELKETEEKRKKCLDELKKMLSKDKRMRYRMDDDYLLRFLRFRKFDVQKAYIVIRRFYTMRNEDPILFTLPPDVELKMRRNFSNLMPYTNDNGETVFIHRAGYWNPSEISVRDLCVLFSYASDVVTMNPHVQIDGAIAFLDLGGLTSGQLACFLHPSAIKLWTKVFQTKMKKVDVKVDPSLSKELVLGSKIFRSACDYHLTESDLQKARKELKETKEKRTCLVELKKILSRYWDASEVSVRDFCVMFNYASDVISMNPHAQIDGVILIVDFKDISARVLAGMLHPPSLKLFTKVTQEMYPWRIKKIIFFNCSAVLHASIYVIRCFLKKKINDRIILIRPDLEELHKHVNPAILPREYGGNLDDKVCCSYLKNAVFNNKEYLRYENSFIGYDE